MSVRLTDTRPLTALLRAPNGRGQRPSELFLASLGLGLSHPTEASVRLTSGPAPGVLVSFDSEVIQ